MQEAMAPVLSFFYLHISHVKLLIIFLRNNLYMLNLEHYHSFCYTFSHFSLKQHLHYMLNLEHCIILAATLSVIFL
jgi:hypothetical protein